MAAVSPPVPTYADSAPGMACPAPHRLLKYVSIATILCCTGGGCCYCVPPNTSTQCDVDQPSVCPHRAIVNLLRPASTQCGVGPVCVPIELLSTYFNLPQPSVMLVNPVCVPIELLSTFFNLPQPSVVLVQCVSP